MLKTIVVLVCAVVCLSGCMSTKKYHGIVSEKYNSFTPALANPGMAYFSVNTDLIPGQTEKVKTQKIKHFFIPAFVYWGWESTIRSQLDPKIQAQQFTADLQYFADSLQLENKLGGSKIEVTVHSLPASFVYTRKGYVVFLLVAYVNGSLEAIFPDPNSYHITYRKVSDGTTGQTGTITVPNHSKPLNNVWKSGRKFTWLYMDLLNRHMRQSARATMQKLVDEIDQGG